MGISSLELKNFNTAILWEPPVSKFSQLATLYRLNFTKRFCATMRASSPNRCLMIIQKQQCG
jgi:hypothetical protein